MVNKPYGYGLDTGLGRDNNEDSLATINLNPDSDQVVESVDIFAIADGMGGHDAGEVASQLAIHTAVGHFVEEATHAHLPPNYQAWLKSAARIANKMVYQRAIAEHLNMGTTLVMAAVVGNHLHVINIGDSRAYLITPHEIRQITKDHSFVQMLVDAGVVKPEEADHHPRRNILTKSIGKESTVEIDTFQEQIEPDSYLLLCSDGLWEMVGKADIHRIVQAAESPQAGCKALVEAANQAGGDDNIAVVLARLSA